MIVLKYSTMDFVSNLRALLYLQRVRHNFSVQAVQIHVSCLMNVLLVVAEDLSY